MDEWYSVRCIFKLEANDVYEERATIWRADSFPRAIELAEHDADEYAKNLDMTYLGLAQAYRLPDQDLSSGSEVFSLMRNSDLKPDEYLRRHYNTGTEFNSRAGSS